MNRGRHEANAGDRARMWTRTWTWRRYANQFTAATAMMAATQLCAAQERLSLPTFGHPLKNIRKTVEGLPSCRPKEKKRWENLFWISMALILNRQLVALDFPKQQGWRLPTELMGNPFQFVPPRIPFFSFFFFWVRQKVKPWQPFWPRWEIRQRVFGGQQVFQLFRADGIFSFERLIKFLISGISGMCCTNAKGLLMDPWHSNCV